MLPTHRINIEDTVLIEEDTMDIKRINDIPIHFKSSINNSCVPMKKRRKGYDNICQMQYNCATNDVDKKSDLKNTNSKPPSTEFHSRSSKDNLESRRYRDLSMLTDEEAVAHIKYKTMVGRNKALFPVKLHKVIQNTERYGFSTIISWLPHGRAFKIHDDDAFLEKVMPHFFFQSRMSSFTAQLKMYGFHRIKDWNNADKGEKNIEILLPNILRF